MNDTKRMIQAAKANLSDVEFGTAQINVGLFRNLIEQVEVKEQTDIANPPGMAPVAARVHRDINGQASAWTLADAPTSEQITKATLHSVSLVWEGGTGRLLPDFDVAWADLEREDVACEHAMAHISFGSPITHCLLCGFVKHV